METELRRLAERWARLDPLVRSDAPVAIHQMRVVCRRARSLLATYQPLFDSAVTEPLRVESRWYAALLGEARDAEVLRGRIAGRIAGEPTDLVGPEAVALLLADLDKSHTRAHEAVGTAMRGRRFAQLARSVQQLADEPPLVELAARPASDVLPSLVLTDWKRLRRRAKRVAAASSEATHDEALHEVRKAGKRLRYAAEVAAPVAGEPASRLARAAKKLQSVLGDQQDSAMARVRLQELSARDEGDTGFVLGRLHSAEQDDALGVEAEYEQAWAQLKRKRLRRWLS